MASKELNKAFSIGSLRIDNPLISAPMAGISGSPYRLLTKKFGASLSFSEMISCEALIRYNLKTKDLMYIDSNEHPVGIQIFGSNPDNMAKAAQLAMETGADLIDINMGCPIPKVLKTGAGAALLLNQATAVEIAQKVIGEVNVPVTVKLRSDYRNNDNLGIKLAKKLEAIGVSALCIHPRSCAQRFSGKADWGKIKQMKESSSIPVIGSGDVFTWQDVIKILETTLADGVMIARGALGNPWIFSQAKAAIEGKSIPENPTFEEKIAVARDFYSELISFYGEKRGVKIGRKYLLWFIKGVPKNHAIKDEIIRSKTSKEILDLLNI